MNSTNKTPLKHQTSPDEVKFRRKLFQDGKLTFEQTIGSKYI